MTNLKFEALQATGRQANEHTISVRKPTQHLTTRVAKTLAIINSFDLENLTCDISISRRTNKNHIGVTLSSSVHQSDHSIAVQPIPSWHDVISNQ